MVASGAQLRFGWYRQHVRAQFGCQLHVVVVDRAARAGIVRMANYDALWARAPVSLAAALASGGARVRNNDSAAFAIR